MSSAETLLSQAVAAFNRGDLRTAADRFERAATTLAGVNPADAVLALESAARVRLMLDQPRHAALAAAKARALHPDSPRVAKIAAELADHGGDLDSRRAAWREVAERGSGADKRGAHVRLAYLDREAGDPASAAQQFEQALALETDDAGRAELQLEIAVTRTITGDYDAALAMLDQLTSDAHVPRVIGQRGVIALARGDTEQAFELAQRARQEAVARNDVMTYLGTASLIAMIHEQAGRLVEAYVTYIRARESLADLLGDEGRALVQPAVTLFQERVGQPKFDEVWNAWVAMRKAAR
jgi:tetratricopeptide (TPR) repeat protein